LGGSWYRTCSLTIERVFLHTQVVRLEADKESTVKQRLMMQLTQLQLEDELSKDREVCILPQREHILCRPPL